MESSGVSVTVGSQEARSCRFSGALEMKSTVVCHLLRQEDAAHSALQLQADINGYDPTSTQKIMCQD